MLFLTNYIYRIPLHPNEKNRKFAVQNTINYAKDFVKRATDA